MNNQIMYEFNLYGIEVLDFFKLNFDRLLDPNIISIKCNQDGIHVFRIDYEKDKNTDNYKKFIDQIHVVKNPTGITNFFLHWEEIFNEEGKYPFGLENLISDVFVSDISYEEKRRELGSFLDEIFNDFEPNLVESIHLFGEADYFYRLYKADIEQNSLFEKYDALEAKFVALEDNYNEMADRYKSSVEYLLKNSKEICSKPALAIFRRLEKILKTKYLEPNSISFSSEKGIKNRWDELGKWVFEGSLLEMARSDVSSDVESLLETLSVNEKQAVLHDTLNTSDLDFDVDNVINSMKDIAYFYDQDQNFISPLVSNLLSEAADDWRDKI